MKDRIVYSDVISNRRNARIHHGDPISSPTTSRVISIEVGLDDLAHAHLYVVMECVDLGRRPMRTIETRSFDSRRFP